MEETFDYSHQGDSAKLIEDRVYKASLALVLYLELYWVFIGGFMELIGSLMKNPTLPFVMSLGWWLSLVGLVLIVIINVYWRRGKSEEDLSAKVNTVNALNPFTQFNYWFNFLRVFAPVSFFPFALFLILNSISVVIFMLMLASGKNSQYPQGHGMGLSAIAIPVLAFSYLIAHVAIKVLGVVTLLVDIIRICISSNEREIAAKFHPLVLIFMPGILLTIFMYGFILFREVRLILKF